MQEPAQFHPLHPSKKAIIKASAAALVVALVILFTAVLPAEYGIDPTGAGMALGFSALNATETTSVLSTYRAEPELYKENIVTFRLEPNQGFEYKFKMKEGQMLLYSWTAKGEVDYEFHGQLEEDTSGAFTSYEKSKGASASGSLVAPYEGIHGWFWHNKSGNTVTLTLTTAGYYEVKGVIGAPDTVIVSSK